MKNVLKLLTASAMRRRLLVLVGIFILIGNNASLAQEPMSPGRYKAPLKYAMQLPPYCGNQYFNRTEPQYQMPGRKQCGVRTNHFCPGLVFFFQARDTMDKAKKMNYYRRAERGILYTKRGIEPFPQCPLHPVVEAALAQVRAEMQIVH